MENLTVHSPLEYTIFSIEDGETYLACANEKEVLEYLNGMIEELNEECEESEIQPLCYSLTDFNSEYYGLRIVNRNNKDNEEVVSFIKQALKFNSSWSGKTVKKDRASYYTFSIKPLYIGDTDYIIQVVCNLMCPSGYSDNGIKYVKQYKLNKYSNSSINYLCTRLVQETLRGKEGTKEVEYIQF